MAGGLMENLPIIELVSVTEAAALAGAQHMGQGNNDAADRAAVEAMRVAMSRLDLRGVVVIGEGERDQAPMLYIGEVVGGGGSREVDIAVDPLEGTNLVAKGLPGALSVLAVSEPGGLLHAPDIYMDKLIVGPTCANCVDIRQPVEENLSAMAKAFNRSVRDLAVTILDRPRHADLIARVRAAGARIKLISDGDVSAAIAAAVRGTGVHAVMGIGGAPEGVLAAAALRCLGGKVQGRFWFRTDEERERVRQMGVADPDRVFDTDELAPGDEVVFVATGITDSDLLRGVRFFGGGARTHSLVMMRRTGEIRFVDGIHISDRAKAGSILL